MIKTMVVACLTILMGSLQVSAAVPVPGQPGQPAAQTQPDPAAVSVAVLDYDGALPGNADLGKQLADILSVRLSIDDAFVVVERARLGQVMAEQHLTLTGLVDSDKAAQVGKLIGAKLLVMGKAFMVDKSLMIVTKVVGVETGQLKGSIRQVDASKPLSDAIVQISEDVAGLIHKDAAKLLPKDVMLADQLGKLRERLAAKAGAKIAVIIPEFHITRRVVDPAVETEIKKSLLACGLTVVDTGKNDLADWAKNVLKSEKPAWPAALGEADYVVIGEAFSEFAARTGELVTCAARAEINLIDRKAGQIVLADRQTERAVDLAEALAGKTALQKAGHKLAIATLNKLAEVLPAAEKKQP